MRPQTAFVFLSSVFTISLSAAQAPPPLIDALNAAGASRFAQFIQSDPAVLAVYLSNSVGTVFAPADVAASPPVFRGKEKRQTQNEEQAYLAAGQKQQSLAQLGKPPGAIIPTSDTKTNLKGQAQSVVTDARNGTSSPSKRGFHARQANTTTTSSLLKINSGLGHVANVLKADIAYSGGVIHLVDNYFTVPEVLSTTAQATGQTIFNSLAQSSNLTNTLDNTPSVTVFLPSDAAFTAANASTPSAATAALISGHVVPNFLGYLPNLENGATLVTQGSGTLTVTVKGSDYFINDAKIITANMILPNGVAHVIDKVIVSKPATVVSSNAPFVNHISTAQAIGMACGIAALPLLRMF